MNTVSFNPFRIVALPFSFLSIHVKAFQAFHVQKKSDDAGTLSDFFESKPLCFRGSDFCTKRVPSSKYQTLPGCGHTCFVADEVFLFHKQTW
jgi:hypothetical protein